MDALSVESRVSKLEGKVQILEKFVDKSITDRELLHAQIGVVSLKLDRIQTFGGAVAFLVTGIWAVLTVAKDWLID